MYLLPRQLLLGVAIIACCFGGIFAILPVRGYAWPQLCACGRTVRGGRGCAPVAAAVRLWPQLCAGGCGYQSSLVLWHGCVLFPSSNLSVVLLLDHCFYPVCS